MLAVEGNLPFLDVPPAVQETSPVARLGRAHHGRALLRPAQGHALAEPLPPHAEVQKGSFPREGDEGSAGTQGCHDVGRGSGRSVHERRGRPDGAQRLVPVEIGAADHGRARAMAEQVVPPRDGPRVPGSPIPFHASTMSQPNPSNPNVQGHR